MSWCDDKRDRGTLCVAKETSLRAGKERAAMHKLYIGFKGSGNISGILARALSEEAVLLTNSFAGVKKDIEAIGESPETVYMFGLDKELRHEIRIEAAAERGGSRLVSKFDIERMADSFTKAGITNRISDEPTSYLCNEAYWYALKQFQGRAVFIHVPPKRYAGENFIARMKEAIGSSK